jgi:hypothetical protein
MGVMSNYLHLVVYMSPEPRSKLIGFHLWAKPVG